MLLEIMRSNPEAKVSGYSVNDRALLTLLKRVKSSMARSLPVENLLPQNVGSVINYLQ